MDTIESKWEAFAQFIARSGGPVSFEAFMRGALYAPDCGYYAKHAGIGRGGDFSTTGTLSGILGEAIAQWITQRKRKLFGGEHCVIIELGAGDGSLLSSVMLPFLNDTCEKLDFFAVDTSYVFQQQIRQLDTFNVCIHIFDTLAQALAAADGRALIYSNEFPDAFPAAQLMRVGDAWHEIFVGWDEATRQPVELTEPLTRGIDADAPNRTREGQRLFIHPGYHQYLKDNLPALVRGAMLTIDYGRAYPSSECRAYENHQRYEGIELYANMGRRDITCDVNFADLQRWGEQLGLETPGLCTQAEFLEQHLTDLEERKKSDETIAFLANPSGAGGAFMVLEQQARDA